MPLSIAISISWVLLHLNTHGERWLYLCTKEICYFKQCNVNVLINFQEQIGVHEIYGCDIHVAEEIPPGLTLKGVLVIKKNEDLWHKDMKQYIIVICV